MSRSAARPTMPLWLAKAPAAAISACTSAATTSPGASVSCPSISARADSRATPSGLTGRPRSSSGTDPAAARACIRAIAWTGERFHTGSSPNSSVESRTAARASSSPPPAASDSAAYVLPSSDAVAAAPSNSDRAVSSGVDRRRPRSRNIESIPSRVAANADGTPSRRAAAMKGSDTPEAYRPSRARTVALR